MLKFIQEYWTQIVFLGTLIVGFYTIVKTLISATKCSLRNDILEIWDKCKGEKKITTYELQAISYSSELYFKLKGNSFVNDIVEKVKNFEIID